MSNLLITHLLKDDYCNVSRRDNINLYFWIISFINTLRIYIAINLQPTKINDIIELGSDYN